jgi:gamma-glutamyltranspeptidase/glutathione hydrolase
MTMPAPQPQQSQHLRPPLRLTGTAAVVALALVLGGCNSDDDDDVAANACAVVTDSGAVTVGSGLAGDPAAPEPASGFRLGKEAVHARTYMVSTANPLASKAGCDVLKSGGSAVDAAVAVQMVLGLVEPQSSGIGGGAFMLHYDAATKKVVAYDGRETAPAAATENYLRWVSNTDQTAPQPGGARASGRSIGTPGTVRMLDLAHAQHGDKPWNELLKPAIDLATNGFAISGRMAQAIAGAETGLKRHAEATAYFFNADGTPKALGTLLKNPDYAATLTSIANNGADAFYTGAIAQGIVDKIKVSSGGNPAVAITPGLTELTDLANYEAKAREAVCTSYRAYEICGMPPPSSGGITVAQIMGILENFDMAAHKPTDIDIYGGKPTVMGVHLVAEAGRLAYADRNKYIADTDFTPMPGASWNTMLNKP